jgi:cytochrome P450
MLLTDQKQANLSPYIQRDQTPNPGLIGRIAGGHLSDFNRDALGFITRSARRYGDLVELRFGPFPIFLISHPDLIEEVLVAKNHLFMKGRGLGRTRLLLGQGLLTSEGEFWKRQRRLSQPSFHRQRMLDYAGMMVEMTCRMFDGGLGLPAWQPGQVRNIHGDMLALTVTIVSQALFGVELSRPVTRAVQEALLVTMREFNRQNRWFIIPEWVPTPSRRRFDQAIDQLEGVVSDIIRERREKAAVGGAAGSGADLLQIFLEAQAEDAEFMTDQLLRDEVMTFLLAGHETTANALTWSWLLLAQHPQVEAALHAELGAVLGGRLPTAQDIPNLKVTGQILQESMRLYPPAWVIGRQARQETTIGGAAIPEGAGLLLSPYVVQRDARFFPEPEKFDPSRWTDEFTRSLPTYAYFPFGGGPRLCIGKPFTLMEATLVLAMVAQRYRLRLEDPLPIAMEPSITLRPRDGLRMRLEEVKT